MGYLKSDVIFFNENSSTLQKLNLKEVRRSLIQENMSYSFLQEVLSSKFLNTKKSLVTNVLVILIFFLK